MTGELLVCPEMKAKHRILRYLQNLSRQESLASFPTKSKQSAGENPTSVDAECATNAWHGERFYRLQQRWLRGLPAGMGKKA